ncbi:MAG: protein kinase [Candidatus Latescibacteria bacterium]|nr:protein kinase [Candidatus Latescibacterota bacterium]NIO56836.1 protein kinase [Candidatus Latescibacterota bacterium]
MNSSAQQSRDKSQSTILHPRYEILEKLGEGGVAVVYKVLDQREEEIRALKVLKPARLESETAVEHFEDEFRILRNLRHPSLPRMYDYGINDDGTPYMVMEYIEGDPLDAYYNEHEDELRLLLYEITEALAFIHEHNLLHLDLKPDNILVRRTTAYGSGEKPQVLLIDFGLSYRRDTGGKAPVSGTPEYMAPEIIKGEERLTRAVDYYGLGVSLYRLIEGRPPFGGSLNDMLRAHLYDEVTFEEERIEHADLYPHVRALMSKEPMARLEAFEAFRRMLAARVSSEVPPLERAYAVGYIESLGMIGKKELWADLNERVTCLSEALSERRDEMQRTEEAIIPGAVGAEKKRKPVTSTTDLLEDIRKGIPARKAAPPSEAKGPITDQARTMVITGPTGSGKSYLADALKGECLMKGMGVWMLGEGGDYETLVSEDPYSKTTGGGPASQAIDPRAIIIDRFVRGWERLEEKGKTGGSMLIVDGYNRASKEEREFVEYVGKRLQIVTNEGREPGVFIMATGRSPRLRRDLKQILPKDEKLDTHLIPPTGKRDVEAILSDFHGRMSVIDDRKQLGVYLASYEGSSGSIAEALRQAVVRSELVREEGRWRFVWATQKARKLKLEKDAYYQLLLEELGEEDREVVNWLSCHRTPLPIREFLEISGLTEEVLRGSQERLKPYRLIETTKGKGETFIGIVSEAAADGLYRGIPRPDRNRIHKKYLAFLGDRLDSIEARKAVLARRARQRKKGKRKLFQSPFTPTEEAVIKEYGNFCELMAFHYGRVGMVRPSLLTRVKALKAMKQVKDIFGMRRLCEEGIAVAKKLRGKHWQPRKWHIERYFIKEWVEAEWRIQDFRAVINIAKENIVEKSKELPLSSLYKYGMALRWHGDFESCARLIERERKKREKKIIQRNSRILLVEVSSFHGKGLYTRSLKLLDKLIKNKNILSNNLICTAYVYYTLNYYRLGLQAKYHQQLNQLKQYAEKEGFYDELLLAHYHKIEEMFSNARYSDALKELRKSIQLANRMKMYHRLSAFYHQISGVYYEQGNYEHAIRFLDKAVKLASNLGLIKWAAESKLRMSFNFEKMGYWGNATSCADRVRNNSIKNSWQELRFFSVLQLFNLSIEAKNIAAHNYKKECARLSKNIEKKSDIALYQYLLGNYYHDRKMYDNAIRSYKNAKNLYLKSTYEDDSVRSELKIAYIYLEMAKYDQTIKLLSDIERRLKKMESPELLGIYLAIDLAYKYIRRFEKGRLIHVAKNCEKHFNLIRDVDTYLNLCSLLFRVYGRIGNMQKSIKYFELYHKKIRMIVNQLDNAGDAERLIEQSDYTRMKKEAMILMMRKAQMV